MKVRDNIKLYIKNGGKKIKMGIIRKLEIRKYIKLLKAEEKNKRKCLRNKKIEEFLRFIPIIYKIIKIIKIKTYLFIYTLFQIKEVKDRQKKYRSFYKRRKIIDGDYKKRKRI